MDPRRLERQLKFLEENSEVDIVDTAMCTVDNDLTPLGIRGERPLECDPVKVLRQGLLMHATVMGRKEWFRSNPYDPAYIRAEDRELWSRTCRGATRFARIPEPLYFCREGLSGNLRNYLRTGRTVRKILHVYGPPLVGRWHTMLLIAQSHARDLAYRVCTGFGLQRHLIATRNHPLGAAEVAAARAVIGRILRAPVPGLGPTEGADGRGRCHESVGNHG
jgi:hypothetical protein